MPYEFRIGNERHAALLEYRFVRFAEASVKAHLLLKNLPLLRADFNRGWWLREKRSANSVEEFE